MIGHNAAYQDSLVSQDLGKTLTVKVAKRDAERASNKTTWATCFGFQGYGVSQGKEAWRLSG